MSKMLVAQYLNDLSRLKQVSGTHRESVVREAFKDLLKGYARSHDLVFVPEFEIESPAKERRYVDGALLHALRMPFGYWEAKDANDDLDAEIALKFRRGYPKDNIIFEDSVQAVLIQDAREVMRCAIDGVDELQRLLDLFFRYQRPEIAEFRKAVTQFTTDLPAVLKVLRELIDAAYADNAAFRKAALTFLDHARETINPHLVEEDVREILIQHILTDEIFDQVFPGQPFHKDNNVARELHKLEDTFFTGNTKFQLLKSLEVYYRAIRGGASQISGHHEKQTFLKLVYENFYKVYNPKAADRLGVVYTPNEVVRFMIESSDWLCGQHFGRSLIDRDVEILDPACGTGTFIAELIEHFRGQPAKLKHKYLEELHANEVAILPYYVANLNIEATYAAIAGEYHEFPGLCLVDTLDNVAGLGKKTGDQIADLFGMGEENIERIKRQNRRKISVIIGNPPYNANQLNENDNNKNREYAEIDRRIKNSYIKASTAQKTKLYDMYARFFRWASDRLHDDGVLALITNRSFIDSRTFDGFRTVVAQEFNEIRIVDLGGDVRANPKLSGTKHNVFGIQTGVAISFLVKRRSTTRSVKGGKGTKGEHACRIFYTRRPEFETAEEKLAWLGQSKLSELATEEVRPDAKHNWIGVTKNDFDNLLPVAQKRRDIKAKRDSGKQIFDLFSLGVSTNRDAWVIDLSDENLSERMRYFVKEFDAVLPGKEAQATHIKWSRNLKRRFTQGRREEFDDRLIKPTLYRPYVRAALYDSPLFIDERGSCQAVYPTAETINPSIALLAGDRQPFCAVATNIVPNLALYSADPTQYLPLQRIQDGQRVDNITDWALRQFKDRYKARTADTDAPSTPSFPRKRGSSALVAAEALGPGVLRDDGPKSGKAKPITKQAIFHYVYAVLHDPLYREKYAQNLKREFPRIPFYDDFWQWAAWGGQLMALHLGYETVIPWPLQRIDIPDVKARANGAAPKAMLKADTDTGRLLLDSETTLAGVPAAAWTYKLGNRSALEWMLDQYKEKKPKDPTIRDKFNTYRFADHKDKVIDLLSRVTRVSVQTQGIVDAMRQAKR
jgi:predicted helicase